MSTAKNKQRDELARQFRESVDERLQARGRGKRFPRDLQASAVAYYKTRIDEGSYLSEAARELGLPAPTLRRWVLDDPTRGSAPIVDAPRSALPAAALALPVTPASVAAQISARRVEKMQIDNSSGTPVLVTPGGTRIEGLDMDTLLELVIKLEKRI